MKHLKKKNLLKWRGRLSLQITMLVLVVLVASLGWLGSTWASGSLIGDNILTDVELTLNEYKAGVTEPLSPADYVYLEGLMPNPYDVTELLDLRIHYEFELPQGHLYNNDDYYVFDLPDQFQVFLPDGPLVGNLSDGVKVYGTYELKYREGSAVNGTVKLTFNENIRSGGEGLLTKGWVSFNTKIIKANITSLEEIITFEDISEETSITLKFEPKDQANEVTKSGTGNRPYNTEEIEWTVDFNKGLKTIVDPVLKDPLSVNLSLDPGSIKIYKLVINLNGTIQSPADLVYGDDGEGFVNLLSADNLGFVLEKTNHSGSDIDFQIRFINSTNPDDPASISEAYRLTFKTLITDGDAAVPSSSYSNTITLVGTVAGVPYSELKSATVNVLRGAPLEKEDKGVAYEGLQTANWEVRVNYNKKSYDEDMLVVTDTFDSNNHKLDESSFKVFMVVIDDITGDILNQDLLTKDTDYTMAPKDGSYEKGYVLTILGKTADAYKITYDTIPINRIEANTSFTNSVLFDDKTKTASQNVNQTILAKSNSNPNYDQKTVDWVITINRDQSPMEAVYLADNFTNMGLRIKEGTFSVTGDEITAPANYVYSINEDYSGFRVEFNPATTFSKQITIRYTTYFDYQALLVKNDNFINSAQLSWAVGGAPKYFGPITSTFNPNTLTKNNGLKRGVYNAQDKTITWTIGVNYNLQTITEALLSDTISGNQRLIANSISVYNATLPLPSDGGEPQKGVLIDYDTTDFALNIAGDASSFVIAFPSPITSAYIIEYKTSLAEIFVASSYTNTANFTGKINDGVVSFTYGPSTVTVPKGTTYVSKSSTYNQGSRIISWSVEINGGQSTITDVVVEDELSPAGLHVFLEDSLNLYATNVNATTGALSKAGDPLVKGTDYQLVTEGIDNKSFRLSMIGDYVSIDKAYILEYKTFVLANNNSSPIMNKVTLTATGLEVGTLEDEKTITVSITTGAGGIYNLTAPATLIVEKQSFTNLSKDEGTLLPGAEFELYFKSGEELTKLATGTTGIDGKLTFNNLAGGVYVLKEVATPNGYVCAEAGCETEIVISTATVVGNEIIESIRNDKILHAVELTKTDSVTEAPIAGAQFELQYNTGQYHSLHTTDEDGKIYVDLDDFSPPLPPGTYRFVERTPATGYKLNTTPIVFTIVQDQITVTSVSTTNEFNSSTAINVDKSIWDVSSEQWVSADSTSGPTLPEGSDPKFKYVVTNTGNVTLSIISFSDQIDGGGSISTFFANSDLSEPYTVPSTLAPGSENAITFYSSIDWSTGQHKNTATIQGKYGDTTVTDTDDAHYLGVADAPSISILKEGLYEDTNEDGIINLGDKIIYTYTVTNTGNVPLTDVSVIEIVDSFTGNGTLPVPDFISSSESSDEGSLHPGEFASYMAEYALVAGDINLNTITNEAKATSKYDTAVVESAPDEAVVSYVGASIELIKTASPTTYAYVGQVITYSFTVRNTGNVTLTNVTIADPFPNLVLEGGPIASLAPGATDSSTFIGTYVVTMTDLALASRKNTATVSGSNLDGGVTKTVTDGSEATITRSQSESIKVTKTLQSIRGDSTLDRYSLEGDTLVYRITLENNGNVPVYNPQLTDPRASAGPFYSSGDVNLNLVLDIGETWVYTASYRVTAADIAVEEFVNTAYGSGSADTTGNGQGNKAVTDDDSKTVDYLEPTADLSVQKSQISPANLPVAAAGNLVTISPSVIAAGTKIYYYLHLQNLGPFNSINALLTDNLPAGISNAEYSLNFGNSWQSWSGTRALPEFVADGVNHILIRGDVSSSLSSGASLVNTASVNADTTDPALGNNQSTLTTTITRSADLIIDKQVVTAPVTAGEVIEYRITVTNNGPSDASNVVVVETLPSQVSAASYSIGSTGVWLDWPVDNRINLGNLALQQSVHFKVRGTLSSEASDSVENSATVSAAEPDPVPGNNSDTNVTPLNVSADIAVTKIGPASVKAGETIQYTITVSNSGPSVAENVRITDSVNPAYLDNVSYSADGGTTWQAWPGSYTYPGDSLAVDAQFAILIRGEVLSSLDAESVISNKADAEADTPDPNLDNIESQATTTVTAEADIRVVKTLVTAPAMVIAGQEIEFLITYYNDGPSDAVNYIVEDSIPAMITDVTASRCASSFIPWTVSFNAGTVVAGGECTVVIRGTVAADYIGTIANTAVVRSDAVDPNPDNNTDQVSGITVYNPGITVKKYVSVNNGASWNDADTALGPLAGLGGNVIFKFVIENTGNVTLTDITLVDSRYPLTGLNLPAQLATGAKFEYQLTVAVEAGGHTNTAQATGKYEDILYSDTDDANYQGGIIAPPPVEPDPVPAADPDPDPVPVPDPKPDPAPPVRPRPPVNPPAATEPPESVNPPGEDSRVDEKTDRDQPVSGKVDVPEGSLPKIGRPPLNGEASVDEDGNWEYRPAPGFVGEDEFDIVIVGENGEEETITIYIDVEEPGVAPDPLQEDDGQRVALPRTDGFRLAMFYLFWLAILAAISFRKGLIPKSMKNNNL